MNKSGEFLMIIIGKSIVVVGRKYRSKWWSVMCSGCKGKRRKDGSCKHERAVLDLLRPDIRASARIEVLK